jgi:hypothetical protein
MPSTDFPRTHILNRLQLAELQRVSACPPFSFGRDRYAGPTIVPVPSPAKHNRYYQPVSNTTPTGLHMYLLTAPSGTVPSIAACRDCGPISFRGQRSRRANGPAPGTWGGRVANSDPDPGSKLLTPEKGRD